MQPDVWTIPTQAEYKGTAIGGQGLFRRGLKGQVLRDEWNGRGKRGLEKACGRWVDGVVARVGGGGEGQVRLQWRRGSGLVF
jgi:hypothetical protein